MLIVVEDADEVSVKGRPGVRLPNCDPLLTKPSTIDRHISFLRSLAQDTIPLHDLAGERTRSNPPARLPVKAPEAVVKA